MVLNKQEGNSSGGRWEAHRERVWVLLGGGGGGEAHQECVCVRPGGGCGGEAHQKCARVLTDGDSGKAHQQCAWALPDDVLGGLCFAARALPGTGQVVGVPGHRDH